MSLEHPRFYLKNQLENHRTSHDFPAAAGEKMSTVMSHSADKTPATLRNSQHGIPPDLSQSLAVEPRCFQLGSGMFHSPRNPMDFINYP